MMTKIVHVQSVLPYEDTMALKVKTGESSIKEAIFKGNLPLFKMPKFR